MRERLWQLRPRPGARRDGRWFVWSRGIKARLIEWRGARRAPAHPFGTIAPADLDGGDDLVLRTLVTPEQAVTLPPVRRHPSIDANPTWAAARSIPAREVLVVRGGQVFGATGRVGARGAVLQALGNAYYLPDWRERTRLAALSPGPVLPGRSVSLTQLGFLNYYHWTMQGLARLATLLAELGGPGSVDRFLHCEPVPPFIAESLLRLGVSLERLHPIGADEVVTCEELACATIVRDDDVIPLAHVDLVRDLYAEVLAPTADEVVYVSRCQAERRHVLNEAEVRGAVASVGGRTVESAGLSVVEQARLFSRIRLLVGVHGADLTNQVFMPATGALLEILPVNLVAAPYATLCRSRAMRYDFTVGTEPGLPRRLGVGLNHADVRVDVADLSRRLGAILGG